MKTHNFLKLTVCLAMAACAPTTQTPNISNEMAAKEAAIQRELVIKEKNELDTRLQNTAAKILMANPELCGDLITTYTGIKYTTIDAVQKDYRDVMRGIYGVGEYPTVTMVTQKTPASGVLKLGDVITHVNGEALPKNKKGMNTISSAIEKNINAEPMIFTVERAGSIKDVTLNPVHICKSPVYLAMNDAVNAYADGKSIVITKGMMRFVENDTELATVIGHELAHNTREHMDSKRGNAMIGAVLGVALSVAIGVDVTDIGTSLGASANSQAFEAEADYVGLYHTARAGFKIDNAPNLWRRMAASNPEAIHVAGTSHPSTAKRFLALEATVKEINKKKSQGKKLVPEEKEKQDFQNKEKGALNE
ncbi:MAG: M48 family metalloprotease [Bdellovibrionales bacterium]